MKALSSQEPKTLYNELIDEVKELAETDNPLFEQQETHREASTQDGSESSQSTSKTAEQEATVRTAEKLRRSLLSTSSDSSTGSVFRRTPILTCLVYGSCALVWIIFDELLPLFFRAPIDQVFWSVCSCSHACRVALTFLPSPLELL